MSGGERVSYTLTVNGRERRIEKAPGTSRRCSRFCVTGSGLTGTKFACGTGQCGRAPSMSTVGRSTRALELAAVLAEGQQITTIEGVLTAGRQPYPLQEAIVTCADVQCGYCAPGMVSVGSGADHRVSWGHRGRCPGGPRGEPCRCTAYGGLLEAVRQSRRQP